MWPLQEIALAQRCCILIGRLDEEFDIGWIFLEPSGISVNTGIGSAYGGIFSLRHQYEHAMSLHKRLVSFFQSRFDDSNIRPSISEVLLGARSLRATEPRDKVFGLHGVLQRLHAPVGVPDYSRSVQDVYVEASTRAIREDSSLRIFEGLTGSSKFNLPSWCPDWSDHQHITKVTDWARYEASGLSAAQFDFQGQGLGLLVHGIRIDVVCQEHLIFAATSQLEEADTLRDTLTEPLEAPQKVPGDQYLDFLKCLFLDTWASESHMNRFDEISRQMLLNNGRKGSKNGLAGMLGYRDGIVSGIGHLKTKFQLYIGLCRRLDRKTLFQTNGGRLGIASMHTKIGDSIVLLQGCNLPMVVRSEGNKWKLVAPAYVPADGIMNGKLWKLNGPLQSFSIT